MAVKTRKKIKKYKKWSVKAKIVKLQAKINQNFRHSHLINHLLKNLIKNFEEEELKKEENIILKFEDPTLEKSLWIKKNFLKMWSSYKFFWQRQALRKAKGCVDRKFTYAAKWRFHIEAISPQLLRVTPTQYWPWGPKERKRWKAHRFIGKFFQKKKIFMQNYESVIYIKLYLKNFYVKIFGLNVKQA